MPTIGILGLTSNTASYIHQLKQASYEIICWDKKDEHKHLQGVHWATNPFAVIAESDILIIARTDEGSYGLITESIMALKPVVIDNLPAFTCQEISSLYKLSVEASIPVIPLIDDHLIHLSGTVHGIFPDGIRFVHGTFKGNVQHALTRNWPFSLMIFLSLIFKSSIQRAQTEFFFNPNTVSPSFSQFTYTNGWAFFYCNPLDSHPILTIDIVGNKHHAHFDLLSQSIISHPPAQNHYLQSDKPATLLSLIGQLLSNIIPVSTLSLLDLKQLLQAYTQAQATYSVPLQ